MKIICDTEEERNQFEKFLQYIKEFEVCVTNKSKKTKVDVISCTNPLKTERLKGLSNSNLNIKLDLVPFGICQKLIVYVEKELNIRLDIDNQSVPIKIKDTYEIVTGKTVIRDLTTIKILVNDESFKELVKDGLIKIDWRFLCHL